MMTVSIRTLFCYAICATVLFYFLRRVGRYIAFLLKRQQTGCLRAPRYPHADPLFGYDLHRQRQRALREGNSHALYTKHFNQLGKTWQENALGQCVINTMDPVNHQYIHATGFENFGKPTSRMKGASRVLGNGVFVAEGQAWKHSRNRIKPIFTRAEVGNMTMMKKHVDRFLELLPRDATSFDVQPMMKKLFLDLSTEFLLGESIDCQLPECAKKGEDFLKVLDACLLGWNKRRQAGWLSIRYIFDKTWPEALSKLYSFVDAHVNRALRATSGPSDKILEENSAIDGTDRHILLFDLAREVRSPGTLRFEFINVFIPSRDTNAALMSNIFFQLSRHPQHWTQLREYALTLPYDPSDTSSLSFSTLKSMIPFRNVIQETLRTLGPAGRIFRMARHNTTLPRGGGSDGNAPVFVPKGAFVCSLTYHIHHDKDIWGADADEFRPDRWTKTPRKPWEFVPFLGGPRICPAQQQVVVQATYLLFRIVREFAHIENRDHVWEYIELQRMAIESRRGVKIALIS